MKNKEKYKDEIEVESNRVEFCDNFITPKVLQPKGISCSNIACSQCRMIQMLWLDEEYVEPETDWTQVEVDTPILVRNSNDTDWRKRYFAKYEHGKVYAWYGGTTSWSNITGDYPTGWDHAKLVEDADEESE